MPAVKELHTAGQMVCTAARSHVRTKVRNPGNYYCKNARFTMLKTEVNYILTVENESVLCAIK